MNHLEHDDVIRPLLIKGWVLTIDPYSAGMPESPDEFIAKYGGSTDEIAIPAKHWLGTTLYRSSVAPNDEKFGLTSQIKRAAISVPSNIAEGQARRSSIRKALGKSPSNI